MATDEFAVKAVHDFYSVKKLTEATFEETKAILNFFKVRYKTEISYSKDLENLAKQSVHFSTLLTQATKQGKPKPKGRRKIGLAFSKKKSAPVPEVLNSAQTLWKELSLHPHGLAEAHNSFATCLEKDVISPLTLWLKSNEPIKKSLFSQADTLLKKRKISEQELDSAKKKYEVRSRDHEKAKKALDGKPNADPDEKKRLAERVKAANKKRVEAERNYSKAVDKANVLLDNFFDKKMPTILTGLQNLQFTRFELLKDVSSKLSSSFEEEIPSAVSAVYQHMQQTVNALNFSSDIESFLSTVPGSPEKPAPYRVEYYRGQNDPSSLTEKQIKKMSGNRMMLEKTLTTLIGRLQTDCKGRDGVVNMLNAGSLGEVAEKAQHDLEAYETNIAHMTKIAQLVQQELKSAGGESSDFGPIPTYTVEYDPDSVGEAGTRATAEVEEYYDEGEEYYEEGEYYEEAAEIDPEALNAVPEGGKLSVLFDYTADGESELSLTAGQIITIISKDESGWWQGSLEDGTEGLFPSNYCAPHQ